jgi:hypothetical protein
VGLDCNDLFALKYYSHALGDTVVSVVDGRAKKFFIPELFDKVRDSFQPGPTFLDFEIFKKCYKPFFLLGRQRIG